jgi:hypothetical protein
MRRHGTIPRTCETCQAPFTAWPHEVAKGWARFCSSLCKDQGRRQDVALRFWSRVDTSGECWIWQGGRGHRGHGRFWLDGRLRQAHVVAWLLTNGSISPDLPCILHHCDNAPCCRPLHLFAGTKGMNNRDRDAKGRTARGEHSGARLHPETRPRGEAHYAAKVTAAIVLQIRARYEPHVVTRKALAAEYGVTRSLIDQILSRHIWAHI